MFGSKEGHSTQSRKGGTLAWLVGGLAGMAMFLLIALSTSWAQSGVATGSALPLPVKPTVTHSKPPPTTSAPTPSATPTTPPPAPTETIAPQPPAAPPPTTRPYRSPSPRPSSPEIRVAVSDVQKYARTLIGSDAEFACMAHIIDHESGWNPHAGNADGSYGVPQALPGHKMSSAGADWRDNPLTQVRWMVGYLHNRYGSACNAWGFWQNHSWY